MDALTFVSNTIGQILSWPVVILCIAVLFQESITERLKDVRKIKTKHFEADFGTQLEKAEAEIQIVEAQLPSEQPLKEIEVEPLPQSRKELLGKLTDLMPNAAILESWRNVERTLDYYFTSRGIDKPKSGQSILGHLDYDPNFPPQLVSAYQELQLLRNRAAHAGENVPANQASEFIDLADRLTYALVNAAEMSEIV